MNHDAGEQLFERFCRNLGLGPTRIAEVAEQAERRPDYSVVGTDGSKMIVEVKIITPTAEEARDIERFERGEIFLTGSTPGERLRRLIGKANQQLKAQQSDAPGILVVFNPEVFLRRHTDPYSILTAMRGLDVVDVEVPRDPRESPKFGPLRSGPRRKMTADANTSTSAIACPIEVAEDKWHVDVFHNRYATKPLPPAALAALAISHWSVDEDERGWTPVG